MISHKHKTIFVHIPKCGGQSIEHMFLNDLGLSWKDKSVLMMRKKKRDEKGAVKLGHLIAADYVEGGYINHQLFDAYYKFTIVRNPLRRMQSAYSYLGYKDLVSFSYFINEVVAQNILKQDANYWFIRPQTDFILDNNKKLLVDDVFKIENIDQSIATIITKSGLQNMELLHINKSSQLGLGSRIVRSVKIILRENLKFSAILNRHNVECDKDTELLIRKLYAADYDFLGY